MTRFESLATVLYMLRRSCVEQVAPVDRIELRFEATHVNEIVAKNDSARFVAALRDLGFAPTETTIESTHVVVLAEEGA